MTTATKPLSALLQRTTVTDHEEVLQACNASLKVSRNDFETQHIKFVALLKLDRYDDALRVLEESGDKLKERTGVERAYALYRMGELEKAKDAARGIMHGRGAKHVEAQAVCILSLIRSREEGYQSWERYLQVVWCSHIDLKTLRTRQFSTRNWREARLQQRVKKVI